MIQISKILCPVDFSEFSRDALDHAVALANWYRAELLVLHVFVFLHRPPGSLLGPSRRCPSPGVSLTNSRILPAV